MAEFAHDRLRGERTFGSECVLQCFDPWDLRHHKLHKPLEADRVALGADLIEPCGEFRNALVDDDARSFPIEIRKVLKALRQQHAPQARDRVARRRLADESLLNQTIENPALRCGQRSGLEFEVGLHIEQFDHLLAGEPIECSLLQPIGCSLRKDATELILRHRHKAFPRAHQIFALQVVGRATRSSRNRKHHHATLWMVNFIHIHTESKGGEELRRQRDDVFEGVGTDNLARCLVANTKNQMAATLVRDRDAILVKLLFRVLILGFLELQTLCLGAFVSPPIDLINSCQIDLARTRTEGKRLNRQVSEIKRISGMRPGVRGVTLK